MNKAEEIMFEDIPAAEKLEKMKAHFKICAEYTDKNQTLENTDAYFEQLHEILEYIVELGRELCKTQKI